MLERVVHRRLHGFLYLLTNSPSAAIYAYALVLLPGVFLHELSHYLTARLLLVRTGRFSLIPAVLPDGTLRLGFVEFYRGRIPMPIRESVIGAAPFIYGTVAVWAIGRFVLNVPVLLAEPSADTLLTNLRVVASTPDFYFWLYLLFAISNSMLPSPSDRQAWPFLLVTIGTVVGGIYFFGMGGAVMQEAAEPLARLFGYLGIAFTLTILVNGVVIVLLLFLEGLFGKILRRRVYYR